MKKKATGTDTFMSEARDTIASHPYETVYYGVSVVA